MIKTVSDIFHNSLTKTMVTSLFKVQILIDICGLGGFVHVTKYEVFFFKVRK